MRYFILIGLWSILADSWGYAATVNMAWDDPNPAGPTPITYIIERKDPGATAYIEVGRATTRTYTDTVAALALTCWQVRATNGFGTSGPSNSVCLDVPKVPVNFTVTTQGPSTALSATTVRAVVRRRK